MQVLPFILSATFILSLTLLLTKLFIQLLLDILPQYLLQYPLLILAYHAPSSPLLVFVLSVAYRLLPLLLTLSLILTLFYNGFAC